MLKEECKKYYEQVLELLEKETPLEDLNTFKERFAKVVDVQKFENDYIYIIVKEVLKKCNAKRGRDQETTGHR